jgi:dTDP-4-amino-4,6-dideoxygalactose transaminase
MRAELLPVPYVDMAAQHAPIKEELLRAIAQVIDKGQFILGDEVAEFEKKFAAVCGVNYAVGVNSGTDALILALRALDIGPADEVITVPNSFVASTSCISLAGARPLFVDVTDDYTIDVSKIEAAITPRTKAILPVHLTGRPCNMDGLRDIASRRNLFIVEDCAQAVLAEYKGIPVGSFGTIGCFSMHPLKTLNACGDAGILTTNDPAVYEKLRIMRNLGLRTRDECVMWASNSRLDSIQAAILLVKLQYVSKWTERRRENARYYREQLANLKSVQLPSDTPHTRSVYHTFVIQCDRRDDLQPFLARHGVGSAIHYPIPVHLQPVGKELGYSKGDFPVTETQAKRILSLPVYPELERSHLDKVCETIRAFYSD